MKQKVWILKFSNEGKFLAAILSNRTFMMWEFNLDRFDMPLVNMHILKKMLKRIQRFRKENAHSKEINNLAWTPDDKRIATISSDHLIKVKKYKENLFFVSQIWNLQGNLLNTLKGHNEKVFAAMWHPSNGELYSGGIDNDIIIWNQNLVQVNKNL